jgi:hypothetical protein
MKKIDTTLDQKHAQTLLISMVVTLPSLLKTILLLVHRLKKTH